MENRVDGYVGEISFFTIEGSPPIVTVNDVSIDSIIVVGDVDLIFTLADMDIGNTTCSSIDSADGFRTVTCCTGNFLYFTIAHPNE